MSSQLKGLIIKNYELITRQKGSLICQVNIIISTNKIIINFKRLSLLFYALALLHLLNLYLKLN